MEDWTEIEPERHSVLWPAAIAIVVILAAFAYQPLEREFHRQVMRKALEIANTRAIPEARLVYVPSDEGWGFTTPTTFTWGTCATLNDTVTFTDNVWTGNTYRPKP